MENHIFRSAIGGFNRQDVMRYIEDTRRQAAENEETLEQETRDLRAALDETREALETRTGELDEAQKRLEALTIECGTAKHNWDAQVMATAAIREDVARRDEVIRELRRENKDLSARVADLEGRQEALRREKERLAQLELDAHQRADAIAAQAEERARAVAAEAKAQAAGLLREAEERIAATVDQYAQLHASFETITNHIISELRKLDVTASQLPINFDHLQSGLAELLERSKRL